MSKSSLYNKLTGREIEILLQNIVDLNVASDIESSEKQYLFEEMVKRTFSTVYNYKDSLNNSHASNSLYKSDDSEVVERYEQSTLLDLQSEYSFRQNVFTPILLMAAIGLRRVELGIEPFSEYGHRLGSHDADEAFISTYMIAMRHIASFNSQHDQEALTRGFEQLNEMISHLEAEQCIEIDRHLKGSFESLDLIERLSIFENDDFKFTALDHFMLTKMNDDQYMDPDNFHFGGVELHTALSNYFMFESDLIQLKFKDADLKESEKNVSLAKQAKSILYECMSFADKKDIELDNPLAYQLYKAVEYDVKSSLNKSSRPQLTHTVDVDKQLLNEISSRSNYSIRNQFEMIFKNIVEFTGMEKDDFEKTCFSSDFIERKGVDKCIRLFEDRSSFYFNEFSKDFSVEDDNKLSAGLILKEYPGLHPQGFLLIADDLKRVVNRIEEGCDEESLNIICHNLNIFLNPQFGRPGFYYNVNKSTNSDIKQTSDMIDQDVNRIIKAATVYVEKSDFLPEPVKTLMDIHVQNALAHAAHWKIDKRQSLDSETKKVPTKDKSLSEIDLLMRKIKISDFSALESLMGISNKMDAFIFRNVNNCVNNLTMAFKREPSWSKTVYLNENASTLDNMYKTYIRQIKAAARFTAKNIDCYKNFVGHALIDSHQSRNNGYRKALNYELMFTDHRGGQRHDETYTSLPINHTQKIMKVLHEFLGDDVVSDLSKTVFSHISSDSTDPNIVKILSMLDDIVNIDSVIENNYEKNPSTGEFEMVERPLSEMLEMRVSDMREAGNDSAVHAELETLMERINTRQLNRIGKDISQNKSREEIKPYSPDLDSVL
jgi:hypothetical protein